MSTNTTEQLSNVVARAATDPAFRQELLSSPEATLASAGIEIPSGVSVQVLENTASLAHVVLPSTDISEADLQAMLAQCAIAMPDGVTMQTVQQSESTYQLVIPPSIESSITSNLSNLSKVITAGSYLAGLGFSIGAIMKFKQHKDNPTQIPIGTPIALVFIAAALLFLPTILGTHTNT